MEGEPMRTKKRSRTLLLAALASLGLAAACGDNPSGPPAAVAPAHEPRGSLAYDENGAEYEMDTGEVACPAILNSHVKYWVNINAVGPRLFTFFAPHTRIGYLGGGVYRYRMTLGRSDDNEWLAEGSWTGKCIGYAQWGIGRVMSFEGTIWRVGDDDDSWGCGGGGSGPGVEPFLNTIPNFSPLMTCSGDGGGGGGGDGGSNLRCYSVTIEHYYYYPDTGEVEYRYSEQYSYCEQVE
jgi:hypothetical protein